MWTSAVGRREEECSSCNLGCLCRERLPDLARRSSPTVQPSPAIPSLLRHPCFTLLKIRECVCVCLEGGGGRVGWNRKERKTMVLLSSFYFKFFSPLFHSLILLMKPGQAGACSHTQQFDCTICASHMGWQRGEGSAGSAAGREARGRKWNPAWPRSQGTPEPRDLLSSARAPARQEALTWKAPPASHGARKYQDAWRR